MSVATSRSQIVFAVPDFEPAVGGTSRQAGLQARGLVRRGYEVAVVTRRVHAAWLPEESLEGLPVHRLGSPGHGRWPEKAALGSLALWLLRERRRIAVFQALMWTDAVFSATAAGLLSRTVVIWALRGDPTSALAPGGSAPRRLQGALRRGILARCTHVVLTGRMAAELHAAGIHERTWVIPVPVDCSHFRPPTVEERLEVRRTLGLDDHQPVILYVGHLQRRKAVHRLVEAAERLRAAHPDLRLLLVGGPTGSPDDYDTALRDQVDRAGLAEAVTFCGVVPDPRRHYWASDVFALPSVREGMPNTILEAMACGLPVVAPESAGGDEMLDAETGVVPPTNDTEAIAEALTSLLSAPERRRRMGEAARNRALAFDVERVLDEYERLLGSLTGAL